MSRVESRSRIDAQRTASKLRGTQRRCPDGIVFQCAPRLGPSGVEYSRARPLEHLLEADFLRGTRYLGVFDQRLRLRAESGREAVRRLPPQLRTQPSTS